MATILAVDDEVDVLEILNVNLRRAGHQVVMAADGLAAVEQAQTVIPDLMILDLMLPELHGFYVCEAIRRHPSTRHIPIIMLTAWASDSSRVLGLEFGADDYLTKPFSPRELVLRVEKMLRRPPVARAV